MRFSSGISAAPADELVRARPACTNVRSSSARTICGETHRKGRVFATKAVEHTKRRQRLCYEDSGNIMLECKGRVFYLRERRSPERTVCPERR